eukprot:2532623-Alexandrium_andersonii.AAC.1
MVKAFRAGCFEPIYLRARHTAGQSILVYKCYRQTGLMSASSLIKCTDRRNIRQRLVRSCWVSMISAGVREWRTLG